MNPKKDEYMRGYGDGFKDGCARSTKIISDATRGEITRLLQERNRFIDMPTMRAIVDEAISKATS